MSRATRATRRWVRTVIASGVFAAGVISATPASAYYVWANSNARAGDVTDANQPGQQNGVASATSVSSATSTEIVQGKPQTATASAFASADLATGLLRGYARNDPQSPDTPALPAISGFLARLSDRLFFDVPESMENQDVFATFSMSVHATTSRVVGNLHPNTHNLNFALLRVQRPGDIEEDTALMGDVIAPEFTDTLTATILIHSRNLGALPIDILADLHVSQAGGIGFIDASNTAALALEVPDGVTWTSESGVFLTGPLAVPEPGTLTLLSAGFVLVGLFRRRRT